MKTMKTNYLILKVAVASILLVAWFSLQMTPQHSRCIKENSCTIFINGTITSDMECKLRYFQKSVCSFHNLKRYVISLILKMD